MWNTVIFIGLVMATDPIRLGLALVCVTRRRPLLNLFAFWLGGMVAAFGLAFVVLVVLRDIALVAINGSLAAINEARSAVVILEGPRLQVVLGLIALGGAIHMAARQRAGARVLAGVGGGDAPGGVAALEPVQHGRIASMIYRLGEVSQNMLTRPGFVWPAFVVGLTSSAPPVETVTAMTVIMGSGAALGTQVSAFVVFILLVLTVIEVPLVALLVKPRQTEALLHRLNAWLTTYHRQIILTMLLITGVTFLYQGITRL
ncbi:GAP family protein [Mycobacterium simiae]|uniref:GAP family protein n=1 Tax=Mycobacterium simiae TaxID=1784 RepID=A0A5B1BVF1_MYCSI|nr:GAP family protein [Mycobacterium simiae]KAA1251981.1 GAP family protein [Mycobacterium simiae]